MVKCVIRILLGFESGNLREHHRKFPDSKHSEEPKYFQLAPCGLLKPYGDIDLGQHRSVNSLVPEPIIECGIHLRAISE